MFRAISNSLFKRYARFRASRLLANDAWKSQQRTWQKLIAAGRKTRLGERFEFGSIHTLDQYQARVPIRDYDAFYADEMADGFPSLENQIWPGLIRFYAVSSGTTTGREKFIPVSDAMLRSNRDAVLAMAGSYFAHKRRATLLQDRFLYLGGSTDLRMLAPGIHSGDLSGIAATEGTPFLRPFSFPGTTVQLLADWEERIQIIAQTAIHKKITAISGVPSWLLVLFDQILKASGKATLREVWPSLQLIMHGGVNMAPYWKLMHDVVGSDEVDFLETYPASEGFFALQDHRHPGGMRLMLGHGIFYEFVPLSELSSEQPTVHTVETLETGENYALVLTSCAGLWRYLVGDTVIFSQKSPPLLRVSGRTKFFLSAFGEHLISEEVENAVSFAADRVGTPIVEFHVGPRFPESSDASGYHEWWIEFGHDDPVQLSHVAEALDVSLQKQNRDYEAHRDDLHLGIPLPKVHRVAAGSFMEWMRSKGKLGGQHKVPRMDNTGDLTLEIGRWMKEQRRIIE